MSEEIEHELYVKVDYTEVGIEMGYEAQTAVLAVANLVHFGVGTDGTAENVVYKKVDW